MRKSSNSKQVPVNLVGSSVFGRYEKISAEKTYNMFISDGWMVDYAGYKRILNFLPKGRGRGLFHSVRSELLICVVNSNVYRLDSSLNPILLGSIESTYGEVYIDENLNNQICIVDGIKAYIYNTTGAPSLTVQDFSSDPGTLVPNYVQYHNTYFLFGNGATGANGSKWYIYEPDGDNQIKYVQSLTLQTKPDKAIAVKRLPGQGNNVLVFGNSVCEIWTQIAFDKYIYRRNSTINVDYGCLNVSTIASSDEYIAWLGVNESNAPSIMVYSGQGASRISTDGIDHVLSRIKFPAQSTACFYRQDGHLFYQLTFYNKEDNLTLAYDFNTKLFFHLSNENLDYHPAVDVVYFNEKFYFLSLRNADLYEMSTDITVFDENIFPANDENFIHEIPRIRICKSIRSEDSLRFIANSMTVTMEQGTDPLVTGISIEQPGIPYVPRVDLSVSYDGGVTFSNEVGRDLNPIGIRKNILQWENMGSCNDFTPKFKFWGMGRFVVNNAVVEIC